MSHKERWGDWSYLISLGKAEEKLGYLDINGISFSFAIFLPPNGNALNV